jgi:hypothetical protein
MASRRDGRSFVIRPAKTKRSPLDVPGVDAGLSTKVIVTTIRSGRRRTVDTVIESEGVVVRV